MNIFINIYLYNRRTQYWIFNFSQKLNPGSLYYILCIISENWRDFKTLKTSILTHPILNLQQILLFIFVYDYTLHPPYCAFRKISLRIKILIYMTTYKNAPSFRSRKLQFVVNITNSCRSHLILNLYQEYQNVPHSFCKCVRVMLTGYYTKYGSERSVGAIPYITLSERLMKLIIKHSVC